MVKDEPLTPHAAKTVRGSKFLGGSQASSYLIPAFTMSLVTAVIVVEPRKMASREVYTHSEERSVVEEDERKNEDAALRTKEEADVCRLAVFVWLFPQAWRDGRCW